MTQQPMIQDYETNSDPEETSGDEAVDFWITKQRELITSTVDYNLGTLADLVGDEIDLKPSYQRRERWDNVRQSRLIESFLLNAPVPAVFLNEDDYGVYSVIDGKQRLTAIKDFLSGKLKLTGLEIFSDVNGETFSTLPSRLQSILRTRPTLRAIIILRQSDEDIKFEIFRRLNTGGVRLNAQEIRNSAYPGPLNDLILSLSEHPLFHDLLRIENKEASALYREMRDAEFVLRFFTFRDSWETFKGGMAREMTEFMRIHQHAGEDVLSDLRESFFATLELVSSAFGEHSFQRWEPGPRRWRKPVLASLFDAQMFAIRGMQADTLAQNSTAIVSGLQKLFSDSEFRRAVDAATNTPSYFRVRVRLMRALLQSVAA